MKKNTLQLGNFLSIENNLSPFSWNSDDLFSLDNIYELEEYRLKKHTDDESRFIVTKVEDEVFGTVESIRNGPKVRRMSHPDMYKPKHTRGFGQNREGYCSECNKWFKLKTSSYWYHMNYKHGINSNGIKYPDPEIRFKDCKIEGFCQMCKTWIGLGNKSNQKSIKFGWYKHWQKNHSVNKTL